MKVKIILKRYDGSVKEVIVKATSGTLVRLIASGEINKSINKVANYCKKNGYYISGIIDADV